MPVTCCEVFDICVVQCLDDFGLLEGGGVALSQPPVFAEACTVHLLIGSREDQVVRTCGYFGDIVELSDLAGNAYVFGHVSPPPEGGLSPGQQYPWSQSRKGSSECFCYHVLYNIEAQQIVIDIRLNI